MWLKKGEIRLHDNINSIIIDKIKSNINSISQKTTNSIAKSTLNNVMQKAKSQYKNSTFEVELETPYYDTDINTLYQAILVKVTSSNCLIYVIQHLEEIRYIIRRVSRNEKEKENNNYDNGISYYMDNIYHYRFFVSKK